MMLELTCKPLLLFSFSRELSKNRTDLLATSELADTAAPKVEVQLDLIPPVCHCLNQH